MADFKESTFDGVKVLRAAVDPTDVIRKQEFDQVLSGRPLAGDVTTALNAIAHPAVSADTSDSVLVTIGSNQEVKAELIPVPDAVIQADATGTILRFAHPITTGVNLSLDALQISNVAVQRDDAGNNQLVTGVLGTDYDIDADAGTVYILAGSNLVTAATQTVKVTFDCAEVKDTAALTIGSAGVKVALGTAHGEAARGNHRHANDHRLATGGSTYSASVTVGLDQKVTADVTLDPSGNLEINSAGVRVTPGSFSTPSHTHSNATSGTAGFMSTADKVKLDALLSAYSFSDSSTIDFTSNAGAISATVKLGAGITTDANGVAADFNAVAAKVHTHGDATGSASGFMTAAQFAALAAVTHTYIGWADSVTGDTPTNFSTTYDANKKWVAFKQVSTPITSPQASDFTGLWGHLLA